MINAITTMLTLLLMTEATQVAIIVGSFGFAGIVMTGVIQVILSYLGRKQVKAEIVTAKEETKASIDLAQVKTNAEIAAVKKNTDGVQTQLLELTSRAFKAEGIKQGMDEERARVPDLITEPVQVHDALNGAAVRKEISGIDAIITEKKNGNDLTKNQNQK